MADKKKDFRSEFTKSNVESTYSTYFTYAKYFLNWALDQEAFSKEQKEILAEWTILARN